jgi:hypothetical protein
MNAQTLTFVIGAIATFLGVWYAALGFSAVKHLKNADEVDRTVGWTLWWCVDIDRYDDAGRGMCRKGQLIAVCAIAAWVAIFVIKPS